MKLLAVGTVAFDAIETPFGKTDHILGGAATYIGLAASVLNIKTGIVSVVGGDFPEEYLNLLKERDIDIEGIEIFPEEKTFFWSGKYHNDLNSRDTLATELNVLEKFNPKIPEHCKNCDILLLGNLHPSVQLSVLENMKTAIIVGSAMASFTVEKFGTERLLEVSPYLLKQRIKKFQELTTFNVDL